MDPSHINHPQAAEQHPHPHETEVGGPPENVNPSSPQSAGEEDDFKSKMGDPSGEKKTGRRKINIEFIEDKSRRHITFSKRKAGIMKKAYELSTLTGTQVLLLVASETGHVYTFATPKLQPLITKPEGKNLIQSCLNASETPSAPPPQQAHNPPRLAGGYQSDPALMYPNDLREQPPAIEGVYDEDKKQNYGPLAGMDMNYPPAGAYSNPSMMNPFMNPNSMVSPGVPRYMANQYQQAHAQQQYAQSAVSGSYAAQAQAQAQAQQAAQYGSPYAANQMHGLPSWSKPGMPLQMPNQQPPVSQQQQGPTQTTSHSDQEHP